MVKIAATTCRTGVVSRAPSRRSSNGSSVGKVLVCKDGDHHGTLRNTQVENEVIKGREHQHTHCVSHVSERSVRLEFDNSQRHEREGDTGFQHV